MNKVILYYTDNISVPEYIAEAVKRQLLKAKLPIISVSQIPIDFGKNICIGPIGRSRISMTKQILLGLDSINSAIVFIAEHDVFYPPDHFDFTPKDNNTIYYNQNMWRIRTKDGANFRSKYNGAVSQLAGLKWTLRERFLERLDFFITRKPLLGLQGFNWYKYEPLGGRSPWCKFGSWVSLIPTLDIRHGGNLTGNRKGFDLKTSQSIPGWGDPRNRFKDFIKEAV